MFLKNVTNIQNVPSCWWIILCVLSGLSLSLLNNHILYTTNSSLSILTFKSVIQVKCQTLNSRIPILKLQIGFLRSVLVRSLNSMWKLLTILVIIWNWQCPSSFCLQTLLKDTLNKPVAFKHTEALRYFLSCKCPHLFELSVRKLSSPSPDWDAIIPDLTKFLQSHRKHYTTVFRTASDQYISFDKNWSSAF